MPPAEAPIPTTGLPGAFSCVAGSALSLLFFFGRFIPYSFPFVSRRVDSPMPRQPANQLGVVLILLGTRLELRG